MAIKFINLTAGEVRDLQAGKQRLLLRPVAPQPKQVSTLDDKTLEMRQDPIYGSWVLTFSHGALVPAMQAGHGWINAAFGKCPFVSPGQRMRVKEGFTYSVEHDNYYFQADRKGLGMEAYIQLSGKSGKVFCPEEMPECASRLTVEVVNIGAMRLQLISPQLADKAGYGTYSPAYVANGEICGPDGIEPLDDLKGCWTRRHAAHPWESNPWIWLATIKQVVE